MARGPTARGAFVFIFIPIFLDFVIFIVDVAGLTGLLAVPALPVARPTA